MRSIFTEHGHHYRPPSARLTAPEACIVLVGLSALAWGILIGGVLALVAVV